jgi:Nucleotidyl transferase AbiEii toxin, Type IV TA system
VPLSVESQWFHGSADVPTYKLEELMGTKLRALYQREKGRDLFDQWLTFRAGTDPDEVVGAFNHYMCGAAFTYPQLRQNLLAKLESHEFNADIETLLVEVPVDYDVPGAADLVMEMLGSRLHNAPSAEEIAGGRWRE